MIQNVGKQRVACLIVVALLAITFSNGCAGANSTLQVPTLVERATTMPSGQPSHITVQHVLIAFNGSLPGKNIRRTRGEAQMLAMEILQRAKDGEDFDALVKEYTDDSPPGIYHMANHGQASDMAPVDVMEKVFPRGSMVPAFGDVGFPLQVGEVGMSQYDRQASRYGWHIVKRLR